MLVWLKYQKYPFWPAVVRAPAGSRAGRWAPRPVLRRRDLGGVGTRLPRGRFAGQARPGPASTVQRAAGGRALSGQGLSRRPLALCPSLAAAGRDGVQGSAAALQLAARTAGCMGGAASCPRAARVGGRGGQSWCQHSPSPTPLAQPFRLPSFPAVPEGPAGQRVACGSHCGALTHAAPARPSSARGHQKQAAGPPPRPGFLPVLLGWPRPCPARPQGQSSVVTCRWLGAAARGFFLFTTEETLPGSVEL